MTAENPPPSSMVNKVLVPLIIAACVCLVLIPSIVAYLPVERSKWLIASALTLLEKNDGNQDSEEVQTGRREEAQKLLKQAEEINPTISANLDYLKVYLKLYKGDLAHVGDVIYNLKDRRQQNANLLQLTEQLFRIKDYEGILKIIDKVFPNIEDREPELNNSWAYAASLAEVRLEDAEKAIDEALKHSSNYAWLDTKAWVLHKLGRNEEALIEMQKAIQDYFSATERYYQNQLLALTAQSEKLKEFRMAFLESDPLEKIKPEELLTQLRAVADNSNESVKDVREKLQKPNPPAVPTSLDKELATAAEAVKKDCTVFRYHRAEIIRGLGLVEIADWEWNAVTKAGFNDPADLE